MRGLSYLLFLAFTIHTASSASVSFAQNCPTITIEGTPELACPGLPLTLTAKVAGIDSGVKLNYEWAVTAGTINSGQGTDTITVASEVAGQRLMASVKVTGINNGCNNPASQETQIAICCVSLFDQYGNIAFGEEKLRLDNFAIQLQHEPRAIGYIMAYGGRVTYTEEARERLKRAKDYLISRYKFAGERIVTMDGGYREDLTVEMWILPPTATRPTPSPTLLPKDVQIIEKSRTLRQGRRRTR